MYLTKEINRQMQKYSKSLPSLSKKNMEQLEKNRRDIPNLNTTI